MPKGLATRSENGDGFETFAPTEEQRGTERGAKSGNFFGIEEAGGCAVARHNRESAMGGHVRRSCGGSFCSRCCKGNHCGVTCELFAFAR